jgi:hypothetical protein
MSYETYTAYLQSNHWQSLKIKVFARFGKRCSCCHSTEKIHGHHLIYRFPLNLGVIDDILPVCEYCHSIIHKTKSIMKGCAALALPGERRAFIIDALIARRPAKPLYVFPSPQPQKITPRPFVRPSQEKIDARRALRKQKKAKRK